MNDTTPDDRSMAAAETIRTIAAQTTGTSDDLPDFEVYLAASDATQRTIERLVPAEE